MRERAEPPSPRLPRPGFVAASRRKDRVVPRGSLLRAPLLILAALLVFGVPSAVEFYTDWLWFGETGYQAVFLRTLAAQSLLGILVFVVVFVFVGGNLVAALRAAPRREFLVMTPEGPRSIAVDPGRLRPLILLAAAVVALLAGTYATSQWDTWLFYRYATPFGQADPILGKDVGFYVFELPFLAYVRSLALAIAILTLVATGAAYVLAGAIGPRAARGFHAAPAAVRHLSLLVAFVFVLLAFAAWLGQAQLLTTASGIVHGASYTDVAARLPVYRILVVVSAAGALLAIVQAFSARFWPVAAAVGLYAAVALGGSAYAALLQRFVVAPNEQDRETPYIRHNIEATRRAFALDTVVEREASGDALLSRDDIDRNAATLRNIPLWDHQPLLDTFGQIQEIRTYYDFVSVHNDRYVIDGEYRQIMLSARELNSNSLPNRTWINERLTFTHGYGLTLGPVNQVTREGLPVLFIRNIPPESTVDLVVTEPSLYYGELSNDYVFVRTRTPEFHYPRGDDNVTTTYEGEGGVPLGGFFRRLLFAIRFRSKDTLFSANLTPESRAMFYRRVPERVRRIAPFLTYEDDRYLAIADGRLYWVQDAYTVSSRYPYSTPTREGGINYIRNSIKATVDAYHGRTVFYLVDPSDPIAQTLDRIFPGFLRPLAEMPEGLRTRLRYPQGIFQAQVRMFTTYHMTNPAVFYNKEDQWEVPVLESRSGEAAPMQPYYTIMKLPGEDRTEFIQMLPLTPRQKDNLAAWMVARSDGANYGRLMVFQFPKQKVVFGPRQVVARINQDQIISPQITLWNQQGSEVIQGTLLVIPIEESLIYIRPLYLRSAGGRIPELKRVIVAYQNQIVMEETLEQALNRIFPVGGGSTPVEGVPTSAAPPAEAAPAPAAPAATPAGAPLAADLTLEQLAAEARAAYDRALAAQRQGDWARYGEEIRRLGEILQRMGKR
jgi:uncharacterized membrane protein (UPF0182 family)